jgi:hypothetical protein
MPAGAWATLLAYRLELLHCWRFDHGGRDSRRRDDHDRSGWKLGRRRLVDSSSELFELFSLSFRGRPEGPLELSAIIIFELDECHDCRCSTIGPRILLNQPLQRCSRRVVFPGGHVFPCRLQQRVCLQVVGNGQNQIGNHGTENRRDDRSDDEQRAHLHGATPSSRICPEAVRIRPSRSPRSVRPCQRV